ncbi:MAG: pyridoxal phosphate-dependent aminotransferase [Coprobacter sp.]|nr:pyridoxal phosphate-dependent aminotransferase [Coprobacter sp.]
MKYDFDTVTPRRGTGSEKWDKPAAGVLPMWVADMDFRTAPCIIEALEKRVAHGIFGYTRVPDAYYEALNNWFSRRHGWSIDRERVIYTSGVVPAISAIIKGLTRPGDRILVQTPAYNCFYSSIRNNGCLLEASPLVYHREGYRIDFEALERQAARPDVKMLLLCNPHNPVGRVWTREELLRIGDICLRHDVFVVSDEIHCELTYEGHDYTPYYSLGEKYTARAAVCVSPSKAFNIAGLQIANIVAADPEVRQRIDRAINDNEVCDVNPFGVAALTAAYNEGEEWLDALRRYLWENYQCVRSFFQDRLPDYPILPLEGTYLVWIDCQTAGIGAEELAQRLLDEERLMVSPGTMYGEGGEHFLRLNIACPRRVLLEGLEKLERGLKR